MKPNYLKLSKMKKNKEIKEENIQYFFFQRSFTMKLFSSFVKSLASSFPEKKSER